MCEKNKIDPQIRSKHLNRYVWMNLAYEWLTNAMNQWIHGRTNKWRDTGCLLLSEHMVG